MIYRIGCSCGETLRIDTDTASDLVTCPNCGRAHGVARPVSDSRLSGGEGLGASWTTVGGSAAAVFALTAVLLWALATVSEGGGGDRPRGMAGTGAGDGQATAGTGTGTGGNEPGDDPWAGRRREQTGTGSGEPSAENETKVAQEEAPQATPEPEASPEPTETEEPVPAPPLDPRQVRPMGVGELETEPRLERLAPSPSTRTGQPARTTRTAAQGPYGQRSGGGGGRSAAQEMGQTKESVEAVNAALEWLARVQELDGHWDTRKYQGGRGSGYDLGCTGLATLAFLADGHTHEEGKYRRTVYKAIDWITRQMDKQGKLQYRTFYEQGICAQALAEDYGMSKDSAYRERAHRAITYMIGQADPKAGGYGYTGPGDDVSVTGFQIQALKAAMLAKLNVPQSAINREKGYCQAMLWSDGSTAYRANMANKTLSREQIQQALDSGRPASGSITRTAIGLLSRLYMGYGPKDQMTNQAATLVSKRGPIRGNEYHIYYGTYCMFQMQGEFWTKWNEQFRDPLIAQQIRDGGPNDGSWDGSVYSTAMNALSLEVYQRYLPSFRN